MNEAEQASIDSSLDASTLDFCALMVRSFGAKVRQSGSDLWAEEIPETAREVFGGAENLQLACVGHGAAHSELAATRLAPGSPLFLRITDRFQREGTILHAMPAKQPTSVHEIARTLLGHYRFDAGQLHLAGCTLDSRPILCLVFGQQERLHFEFFWPNGKSVEPATVAALELTNLQACGSRFPRVTRADLNRWFANVQSGRENDDAPTMDPLARCIVWCHYAEGKIAFSAGKQSRELTFSGWAKSFLDAAPPPPYRCEIAQKESYELDVTDSGQITVASAIAVCEVSGKRVIETQLRTCQVTGQRVLAENVETCPITDQTVLRQRMLQCTACQQWVSPRAIRGGTCHACRRVTAIQKDDPRMARILGQYPGLDRWRRWRMAETTRVYVLAGANLWQQVLIVLDKHDLQPLHLAQAGRFSGWAPVSADQFDGYLQ